MFFQKNKKIIIIIAVLIIVFLAYSFISGGSTNNDQNLLTSSNATQGQTVESRIVGNEIIAALNQIQTLNLSRDIFDDPVFKSLIDRSRPIPAEPVGKSNPFSPIGSAIIPVNRATTTPSVNTFINATNDPNANQPAI